MLTLEFWENGQTSRTMNRNWRRDWTDIVGVGNEIRNKHRAVDMCMSLNMSVSYGVIEVKECSQAERI